MDLERERGITIKAQAVRVLFDASDGETYQLHLIDTPGHVDFTYEVSRSLAACEGALLVVDASQGVEAQTLANTYLAVDSGLELIPCLNKIDLPGAEPERVAGEVAELLGEPADGVLRISAKTGAGVTEVLDQLVQKVPPPHGDPDAPPRALIFDSEFDQYRGVIAYVRVVDGTFRKGEAIRAMQNGTEAEIDDIGFFNPRMTPATHLGPGEVGYVITGIKDVTRLRVGDTLTTKRSAATEPLPGYRDVKPMVFCGLFPIDSDDYPDLRDALEKLVLNDAALSWEPETSDALGFGFRCGFLGLLHMDIVRERLEREYDLELLATMPSVEVEVEMENGEVMQVHNPTDMPDASKIARCASRTSAPRSYAEGVRRHDHGAVPGQARHARRHALPVRRPRAAGVRAAARGDRARLLRPAEVAHEGVRVARLRADRPQGLGPRQARRAAERRPGRRAVDDRAPRKAHRSAARSPRSCARRSRASSSTCRSRRP